MKNTCPLFGKCGGCKFDFTAADYREQKLKELATIPYTNEPVWISGGVRRRADCAFAAGKFGFYQAGTKNIIPITHCPNLADAINNILPQMANIPWCGAGACLITECDNGIDVAITSNVPYFTPEFRDAAQKLPVIRITWNDKVIKQTQNPTITFGGHSVPYPTGAFLQPSVAGADMMRKIVVAHAQNYARVADLFCGLGNFTFELGADGFDIVGTGVKRDLFKNPLTVGMLKNYDCVVMDPPRAGAMAQCQELVKSDVKRVIYVSCNPTTFMRDAKILGRGGFQMTELTPVDQFVGSHHWELIGVFDK